MPPRNEGPSPLADRSPVSYPSQCPPASATLVAFCLARGPATHRMPTLYGNTSGLSPHAHKALERIYRRKVALEHIASPELIKSLAEASHETGRQVGALVHRSGEVDYVIVGEAGKLMLPDIGRLRAAEGRFRALRLIHTHLHNEPLTRDDLVDLVRLRLDMVAAIQLSPEGEPRTIHYAYNTPVFEGTQAPVPACHRLRSDLLRASPVKRGAAFPARLRPRAGPPARCSPPTGACPTGRSARCSSAGSTFTSAS